MSDVDGITCIERSASDLDNYSYFPIVINESFPLTRDELFEEFKKHNIFARKYFYPIMNDLEVYKAYSRNTPNAKWLSEHVLCLPMYPNLIKENVDLIVTVLKQGMMIND